MYFYSEVEKRFSLMPFTLRHFEDEKRARMGVIECAKHDLVEPYPVYQEKEGEFVAEFKFTVLLMPSGQMKITGLPIDLDLYESEYKIVDNDIKKLLTSSTQKKKIKRRRRKLIVIKQLILIQWKLLKMTVMKNLKMNPMKVRKRNQPVKKTKSKK